MAAFGTSLQRLREARGWSLHDLAERLKTDAGKLERVERRTLPPKMTLYVELARAFGMTVLEFDQAWRADVVEQQFPPRHEAGDGIPLLTEVPAGLSDLDPCSFGWDDGVAEMYLSRVVFGVTDPTAFAVRVEGDSMLPDYRPGDVAICSPQAKHEAGMVAAIRFADGTCTLKHVEEVEDDLTLIRLVPANKSHDLRDVLREDIVAMARVVSHVRSLHDESESDAARFRRQSSVRERERLNVLNRREGELDPDAQLPAVDDVPTIDLDGEVGEGGAS